MTDQEIERLALERFPHGVGIIRYILNYHYVISDRAAFIEGAKAMRERFKQDIIEAYREGFTSTESAEQYYERRYNGHIANTTHQPKLLGHDTDSNSHT